MKMRELPHHGMPIAPGQLWNPPHLSDSFPFSSGMASNCVNPSPVLVSLPERLAWPEKLRWSRPKPTRSSTLSRTSSTPGSSFTSKDEEGLKKFNEVTLQTALEQLEKRLVGRGGQYFVGNNLTWADII